MAIKPEIKKEKRMVEKREKLNKNTFWKERGDKKC